MTAKKWQGDKKFCEWLAGMGYAKIFKGKVSPFLSDGVVIYMWEAWLSGKKNK